MPGMNKPSTHPFLAGKVLLAMPGIGDPRFHRAVILVCAHDENGAMGLVVNHLLPGIDLADVLNQLGVRPDHEDAPPISNLPVMGGGPVENGRGFILHSRDFQIPDTVVVTDTLAVTGTLDGLRAVASGAGPKQMALMLGYAGWQAGQLEQEIQENAWLVTDPDPDMIFSDHNDDKWEGSIRALGIDPAMLSTSSGRA